MAAAEIMYFENDPEEEAELMGSLTTSYYSPLGSLLIGVLKGSLANVLRDVVWGSMKN